MPALIDLHLHSSASDGSVSPADLASSLGRPQCVALTDHDTTAGISAFRAALPPDTCFIVGAELSLLAPSGTLHLLCYGAGLLEDPAASLLHELARDRLERNERMLERARSLGLAITADEVLAAAGASHLGAKSVGRPHFAAVLVAHGYAIDVADAFDRWLARGRPLYVPKARHRFDDVEPVLRRARVATVVAHPLSLDSSFERVESLLRPLVAAGLGGIEAYYAAYDPPLRVQLAALAHRLGIIATGGSDAHGDFKPGLLPLVGYGDLEVPESAAFALLDLIARLGGAADLY